MGHSRHCELALGVILAGGRSRRFQGEDKAFQTLAGRTLLDWVVERARPQVAKLIISANGDLSRYRGMGADEVIGDNGADREGPLAGVEAAISWLEAKGIALPWVATFPVDGPFLPLDLVARLLERAVDSGRPAVVLSEGREHPTFGVWPVEIIGDLRSYLARRDRVSIMAFVKSLNGSSVAFGSQTPIPFFNINTPEDLSEAEKMIVR